MAKSTPRVASRSQEILKAGADLFSERGFVAVGVDEIGERAGVTGPAIYRHFRGKDEILATLFDEALDQLFEVTSGEFDDPEAELRRLVRGHAEFVLSGRKLAGVKIREERSLAEPFRKQLHRRERRYIERWTTCLKRWSPQSSDAEITVATHAAIGALNSVATWPPDALEAPDVESVLSDVVLGALAALSDPAARPQAPISARNTSARGVPETR